MKKAFDRMTSLLSFKQQQVLLQILYLTEFGQSRDDLWRIADALKHLFRFCVFSADLTKLDELRRPLRNYVKVSSYPVSFLQAYHHLRYERVDPIAAANFQGKPMGAFQHWDDTTSQAVQDSTYEFFDLRMELLNLKNHYDVLKDGVSFGWQTRGRESEASLFSLGGGIDTRPDEVRRMRTLCRFLAPFLHRLLVTIKEYEAPTLRLTRWERKMLYCLKDGLDLPHIGQRFKVSQIDLTQQINDLLEKLDTNHINQAVAKAVEHRLIEL